MKHPAPLALLALSLLWTSPPALAAPRPARPARTAPKPSAPRASASAAGTPEIWLETRAEPRDRKRPHAIWRLHGGAWRQVRPGKRATGLRGCADGAALYTDVAAPLSPRGALPRGARVFVHGAPRPMQGRLKGLRMPMLWGCGAGRVLLRDVRFHGTALYELSARGLRRRQAGGGARGKGRGVTGHDVHPTGARVWARMPKMGDASESAAFADYFPKAPGSLWYSDAKGRARRLLDRTHALRPRLIDGGRTAVLWSAGTRSAGKTTWLLRAVDVATRRARTLMTMTREGSRSRMPGSLHARAESRFVVATHHEALVERRLRRTLAWIDTRSGAVRDLPAGDAVGEPTFVGDSLLWWARAPVKAGRGKRSVAPLTLWRMDVQGQPKQLVTLAPKGRAEARKAAERIATWRPWLGASVWATPTAAQRWTQVDLGTGETRALTLPGEPVAPAALCPGDARAHGRLPGRAGLTTWVAATRRLHVASGASTWQTPALPEAAGVPVRVLLR